MVQKSKFQVGPHYLRFPLNFALENHPRGVMIGGMETERTCFKCGKKLVGLEGLAMHMPEMGTTEWCRECTPQYSLEEILDSIDRLAHPPQEPGKDKR
jgi:hypothetical protein